MNNYFAKIHQIFENYNNLQKTNLLFDDSPDYNQEVSKIINSCEKKYFSESKIELQRIDKLILSSGYNFNLYLFLFLCSLTGTVISILSSVFIPFPLCLFFFIFGFCLPILFLESKSQHLSNQFAADYPTLLLASASSLKTGLSPQIALKRAAHLLPNNSSTKKEALKLLESLHQGISHQKAVSSFARNIDLPELELFRTAFVLVLNDGGKLSETLERLALVTRDRISLKSQAKVSTTNMKMTANIILFLCPLILSLVALRQDNFWDLVRYHETANLIASSGLILIIFGYFSLTLMARFKG